MWKQQHSDIMNDKKEETATTERNGDAELTPQNVWKLNRDRLRGHSSTTTALIKQIQFNRIKIQGYSNNNAIVRLYSLLNSSHLLVRWLMHAYFFRLKEKEGKKLLQQCMRSSDASRWQHRKIHHVFKTHKSEALIFIVHKLHKISRQKKNYKPKSC